MNIGTKIEVFPAAIPMLAKMASYFYSAIQHNQMTANVVVARQRTGCLIHPSIPPSYPLYALVS